MRYLLDTHLLLWAGQEPERLSSAAHNLMRDESNTLFFSAASLWEVAIKASLKRQDFEIDPDDFHGKLLANSYIELPVSAAHAVTFRGATDRARWPF